MGKSTKEKQQRRLARKAKEQARSAARLMAEDREATERRSFVRNETTGAEVAMEVEWNGKLWNPAELLTAAIADDDLRALRVVEMAMTVIGSPVSTVNVLATNGLVKKAMPCAEFAFWHGAASCGRFLLRDAFAVDKRVAMDVASRMMRALEIEDHGSRAYRLAEAAVETALECAAGAAEAFLEVTELAAGFELSRSRSVLARMRAKERALAEVAEFDQDIVAPARQATVNSL